jgi:hypothetical protein
LREKLRSACHAKLCIVWLNARVILNPLIVLELRPCCPVAK